MRLGEGFRDTPKGLIPFRDTTLIERSLSLIKAAGVNRTVIVTGHCAEMYEALARSSSGFVTTLFNDRYADRGSLVSLSVALAAVQGPCLILDSDIVYDGRGLAALLASGLENAALVSGTTGSGDEYYAWADDVAGQPFPVLRRLSKRLADEPDPPVGEHVGILRVGTELLQRVATAAPAKIAAQPMAFYEDCLIEQLPFCPMGVVNITDLVWCEIDDLAMLERARMEVFPRLPA